MTNVTATFINLYHVCHRQLWLHAHEIRMEHTSEIVAEGKLIGETAYGRRADRYTQVEFDGVKIDFYDPRTRTVHETKRGKAIEEAHRAQVRYYLYKLRLNGVPDARGLIEYPELRKTEAVEPLSEANVRQVEDWENSVRQIVAQDTCPPTIGKPYCKKCSYHDFCYSDEGA